MGVKADSVEEISVGVYAQGPGVWGWRRVLDQEGLPNELTTRPDQPIVVTGGALPGWAERYVADGGVLVVSGAEEADELLPRPLLAVVQNVLPPGRKFPAAAPCVARLFRGEGEGEVLLHEDRLTKDGIEQDRYPLVSRRHLGLGQIIYTGVPLSTLLEAAGDRLRRFSPFTAVTERVASSDKAELSDVLVGMLRQAFAARGMPYLRVSRFPHGADSVLLFRVDVDGAFGDRAERLASTAAGFGVRASFFINGSKCEAAPGELTGWPGQHEVGHHGYVHNVFDSQDENRENLDLGAAWVAAATGRGATSFVAPRGLWNDALDQALSAGGYGYSSDFSLDFDSLPFRTNAGLLQIPVHPYSPERAATFADERGLAPPTADEVSGHYGKVIRHQVDRNRPAAVYGHPQVLGAMVDDVLPHIFSTAQALRIPALTLGEFAGWWREREQAGMRLYWDGDRQHMRVRFDHAESWPVEVLRADRREVVHPAKERPFTVLSEFPGGGRAA